MSIWFSATLPTCTQCLEHKRYRQFLMIIYRINRILFVKNKLLAEKGLEYLIITFTHVYVCIYYI